MMGLQFGGNGPTCAQYIPNLLLPLERVVRRSPKLSDSAERIVTLPEPPVEAYVPPFGLRDTDHANEIKALSNGENSSFPIERPQFDQESVCCMQAIPRHSQGSA